MENIIIVRRKRHSSGQFKCHKSSYFKIEFPRGTFTLFEKTAKLLDANVGDAIMFAFNKKDRCGYIYKESPEPDSYYLGNSGRAYYRFTSKELMIFFEEFFDIKSDKSAYFKVESKCNEKKWFKFTPEF